MVWRVGSRDKCIKPLGFYYYYYYFGEKGKLCPARPVTLPEQEQQHPEGRSAPMRAQLLPDSLLQPGHEDCRARPHLEAGDHKAQQPRGEH